MGLTHKLDTVFLLSFFVLPASIISWFILLVIAIVRLFLRNYLSWQKRLVPIWFLVFPIIIGFIVGTVRKEINKEHTWLTVKQYDFHGSNNFRFMKDGQYESWRDSPLGSSAEISGRYERQDSILTLHPALKDDKALEFKLIIRPYSLLKENHSSSDITLVSLDTTVWKH